MIWILCMPWLVIACDVLEYRYMDNVMGNLFSLFCSMWRTVLKMFVRLFQSSESLEKSLAVATSKEEKGRNRNKTSSCQLENTLTARNYHNSCHHVSSLWEAHSFAKCFCDYSALSKWRHWKTFQRNCIQVKMKKKRRSRDEKWCLGVKRALTSTNP